MDKKNLRNFMAKKRVSCSLSQQATAADDLTNIFCQTTEFLNSQTLGLYWPIKGEISPLGILAKALDLKKKCYLPIMDDRKKTIDTSYPALKFILKFIEYQLGDKLITNTFGIMEPIYQAEKAIAAEELDIVLTPLVAFDKYGTRLGTGGGHYDKTFSFLKNKNIHKPLLVGLAYDWQEVTKLGRDEWDISLARVATHSRWMII